MRRHIPKLLLLLALFSCSSQHQETRPMSVDLSHVKKVDAEVQANLDAYYFTVTAQATTTTQPRPEGTTRAQEPQEKAYYDADAIGDLICSVFTEDCAGALRVARCESGFDSSATNPSGAKGLFQLLGHGDLFRAHGWSPDDWADPYKNTVVAHDLWLSSGWRPWVCAA